MKKNSGDMVWRSLLVCSLVVSGVLSFKCDRAFSQVTADDTLGDESSVVNPRNATSESIDGGAIRGQNLFHSFEEFNVDADRGVYFNNPEAVTNIFSRVTGGNPSNILGTLGVDGAADLFLINPNGIIFGEGASLDVQGSFTATTADGIEFGEQGFFSAVNPESPKLLTIDPSAYFFNQLSPGAIANNSQVSADLDAASFDDNYYGLRVLDGQNLLLLGGDVNVDSGGIVAVGGRIDIGAVTGQGVIGLNSNGSLNIPDSISRGDISLINGAGFLVGGDGGGDIAIAAKNIRIDSASTIQAGILSNLGSPDAQAGDININATDNITIDNSRVANEVNLEAVGNAGDIFIDASSLKVLNGSQIGSPTYGRGDGGNVTIRSSNIELAGTSSDGQLSSGLFTTVLSQAQGYGGNLTVNTDNLSLGDRAGISASTSGVGNAGNLAINAANLVIEDGGEISSSTFGQGNSGNISITVDNSISLDASSYIVNNVQDINAVGDAGKIEITTGSLSVINGSQINSFTRGQGNAGDITIQASDSVTFDGLDSNNNYSSAFSSVEAGGVGDGGNIKITARSLSLINGGQLEASVFGKTDTLSGGKGQGGSINIDIDDTLTISGENIPGIFASLGAGAVGSGGNINIQAGKLVVEDGGLITASTLGKGNAGNLSITAENSISLDDSLIVNNVQDINAVGDAGKIDITTGSLSATNGSQINSFTLGQGNAGDITIQAGDSVTFDGFDSNNNYSGASSSVEAGSEGDGGNINIRASSLNLTNGGELDASVSDALDSLPGGKGQGGNINLDVDDTLTIAGGNTPRIFASLGAGAVGNGGDINIQTGKLVVEDGGQITASTFGEGDSGNLSITADNSISLDASSYILNNVQDINAVGDAGKIKITTGSLSATNGSQINSFTRGRGNAGDLTIQASDAVTFDGLDSNGNYSSSSSSVEAGGQGDGGNINITAGSLNLINGGELNVRVREASDSLPGGQGRGGNINLDVDDTLTIAGENQPGIFATLGIGATGGGGAINITSKDIRLSDNSDIKSNVFDSVGNGGDINITADSVIAFDDSDIFAFARDGRGGNITLNTSAFFAENFTLNSLTANPDSLDNNNRADVNATGAFSGSVSIPDVSFIQNSLTELENNSINTDELVANSCVVPVGQRKQGKFIITGTESLPIRPGDGLPSKYPTGEVRNVPEQSSWQPGDPIIEPQGAYRLANGKLVLSRKCSQ